MGARAARLTRAQGIEVSQIRCLSGPAASGPDALSAVARYRQYSPLLSSTDPTISVSQCTPATVLPTTMKAENRMANQAVTCLTVLFLDLLFTWKMSVGMTMSTSSVVEEK